MTPAKVETCIGTLRFIDVLPTSETVEIVNNHLDHKRGREVFLTAVPGASVHALVCAMRMDGPLEPWIDQTWLPEEIELMDKTKI